MTPFDIADWRRRTFALYAEVRASTDPAAAHDLWRRERDRMFAEHPASPLLPEDLAAFTGLPVTAYDPAWRFEVGVRPAEPRHMDFETGTDGIVPFDLIGIAEVPGVGALDVWRLGSYGGGIFLPVKDALAGAHGGTYGGGRYLIDTIKGADLGPGGTPDSLVLDFNFAYNPSCAYDRIRPGVGLSARPGRQSCRRGNPGRRALQRQPLATQRRLVDRNGAGAMLGTPVKPRRFPCVVERSLFSSASADS